MISVRRLELRKRFVTLDWTTKPYAMVDYVLDGRNLLEWVTRVGRGAPQRQ